MCPKESVKNDRVVQVIKEGVEKLGVRGLARSVGISPSIITRYMQGKVGEPTHATLKKLAEYSDRSISWLRGLSDTKSLWLDMDCGAQACMLEDMLEIYSMLSEEYKGTMTILIERGCKEAQELLDSHSSDISEQEVNELEQAIRDCIITLEED